MGWLGWLVFVPHRRRVAATESEGHNSIHCIHRDDVAQNDVVDSSHITMLNQCRLRRGSQHDGI